MIADVTDPDATQTILTHLRQRAPADAVHRQRPGQGPQNDLFISTATITKSLVDSYLAVGLVSENLSCFSTYLVRNDIDELTDELF